MVSQSLCIIIILNLFLGASSYLTYRKGSLGPWREVARIKFAFAWWEVTSEEYSSAFVRSIRLVRLRPPVCILEGTMLWVQCNFTVGVTCAVRASEMIRGLPIVGQGSSRGEGPNVDDPAGGFRGAVIRIDEAEDRVGSGRGSGKALLGVKMLVGLPEEALIKSE